MVQTPNHSDHTLKKVVGENTNNVSLRLNIKRKGRKEIAKVRKEVFELSLRFLCEPLRSLRLNIELRNKNPANINVKIE